MLRKSRTAFSGAFFSTAVTLYKCAPHHAHNKFGKHTFKFFMTSKPRPLTALPYETMSSHAKTYAFPEEVDRPFIWPKDAKCMQCKGHVQTEEDSVWIPSGNAQIPTKAGYIFHKKCFRCWQCGFRFYNRKFHSTQRGTAICLECTLGKYKHFPQRHWHQTLIHGGRMNSRKTGHHFPRFQSQIDFIFSSDT